jgi:hypothetical protein
MSSFKKLSKSDVTVVPYYANKQWNLPYCPYPTSSEYITIYKGTNLTGSFVPKYPSGSALEDPVTENQYERLVYSQINHLFYQDYTASLNTSSLANSIYYESASAQRPTSSYFIYNDNKNLITNFPTGINEGIRVLAINQNTYGSKLLPYTFQISSPLYNIKDDGFGNLYDYTNSTAHIGNIFYAHGLAIITNQDYQLMFPLPPLARNDYGYWLETSTAIPFIISASVNDSGSGRSGTLNTGSIALSGSISGPGYLWSIGTNGTSSNGTVIFTGTTPGTYDIYYTIKSDIDISGSCEAQLTSNKARIRAIITPDCEFDFTVAFG